MKNRVFAVLMCLAMMLALVPTTAFAIDGAKTYTFNSSQIANLPTSDLRANVYFKGDTIVFTPDEIEPFTSSDHGVCKTPFVGLSIYDGPDGTDVTGGICNVNTYSSDGSGYMVSFTITSDNPVTLDYKGAGPTGLKTEEDANNNYYSYHYLELQFVAHPTSYPVNYVLDYVLYDYLVVNGSWPSGANQPTGLTLNGNTGAYELQIPAPQSNDSSYYLSHWTISENVKILSNPNLIDPTTVYPINGVAKLPLTIVTDVNPYGDITEGFTLTAVWSNISRNAAPTFSVDGGTYTSTQYIALSCATEGAEIFYKTDGSVPTGLSKGIEYTSPIAVSSTTTIVARAFSPTLAGIPESEAVSETYTISATPPVPATVATPTFSPAGGTFTSAQSVTLSCTTAGATIRYTTDGNDPTEASTAFDAGTPIAVSSTTTIKAKAFKDGMTASEIASATYTITPPAETYTFTISGGGTGASGSGSYAPNATVTIYAGTRSNYTFNGWTTTSSGVSFVSASSATTTFSMPGNAVTVTANWTYNGGGGGSSVTPTIPVPASSDEDSVDISVTVSDEGSVDVSATVSEGTANITVTDTQINQIISNEEATGTVKVDVSSLKVDEAVIPAKLVTAAADATGSDGLEVEFSTGSVALDKTALESIGNKSINVSVEDVKTTELTTAQKETLGDQADTAIIVDVNVLVNGVKTSEFNGGLITVSVPYTPKAGEDTSKLVVWYLKDDGTIEPMNGKYNAATKCYEFTTTHLSTYVLVSFPFTDVANDSYYYNAVAWAVAGGVTEGTSATTFSPKDICTRAQMVTFLWRAMGSPEPTSTTCPFTDVSADAYYYKAVLWAAEKGITEGTSDTTFSPNDTVTRAQVVTLEWRAAGKPAATAANPFKDVASGTYYEDAVLWAVAQKITEGTSNTTFSPVDPCTRAQIVTFLYRYLAK